jgi:predicted permease
VLFEVKYYRRVEIVFFFIIWGLWASKDAEVNVDFRNINEFLIYTGTPCVVLKFAFLE